MRKLVLDTMSFFFSFFFIKIGADIRQEQDGAYNPIEFFFSFFFIKIIMLRNNLYDIEVNDNICIIHFHVILCTNILSNNLCIAGHVAHARAITSEIGDHGERIFFTRLKVRRLVVAYGLVVVYVFVDISRIEECVDKKKIGGGGTVV
ncbi:hypothetical protein ACJX0J_021797, partial [Zea mays]